MSTPEQSVEVEETEQQVDTAVDVEEAPKAAEAPVVPIISERPIQTVGRRKEAIVRVRLVAGNGNFRLNGKDLATYFPNKVHQQLIKDPLVIVDKVEGLSLIHI